jgi:hypothetical protein
MKPANKAEQSAAESVERRARAEGNAHQQSTYWTPSQARVSKALERTRQHGAVIHPSPGAVSALSVTGRGEDYRSDKKDCGRVQKCILQRECRTYGFGRGRAFHRTPLPLRRAITLLVGWDSRLSTFGQMLS